MAWDPAQYLAFDAPRLEPAIDLLNRIHLDAPEIIYDLGCGPGTVTRMLRERWPEARVTGLDNSPEMLAQAPRNCPGAIWWEADIATWEPSGPADLIYSNAALQWLSDHETLFPRLLGALAPGGVLAVQMPRNHQSPSWTLIAETAQDGPWAERLRPLVRRSPVGVTAYYYDLLAAHTSALSIWETEYLHVLEGDNPVVAWTRSTALRPLLDALDGEQAPAFEAAYAERIRAAYPPRADGRTLFPFRRLFITAVV
ncbi:MAG: methyltransferase domain-containing protein [Alphaproteobacteria bacterium]|nr:methyltransferase domain-containing protein [Alphaproteobacteria bacterium]